MSHTESQFDEALAICRDVFSKKLQDYGAAWRLMRPQSVTDQLFIKASRIRSIELKATQKVDDDVLGEFIGLVNYAVIGQVQLQKGHADQPDMDVQKALAAYDAHAQAMKALMLRKNHDYDEAWRKMRVSSYTDLILMKLHRIKQIEENSGKTLVSEGIDANYADIANYSVFGIIKIREEG